MFNTLRKLAYRILGAELPSLGLEVTGYPALLWGTGWVDSRLGTSWILWVVFLQRKKSHYTMDIQVDEDFLNKIYNTYTWQGNIFIKALYNCCSYYYRCWTFCEMKETFCKTTSFWSVYFWIYKHQFLLIRFILKWNE